VIKELLSTQSHSVQMCEDMPALVDALAEGGAMAVVAEEALAHTDLQPLQDWLVAQPPWSDFPFVVLGHGRREARAQPALNRLDSLGNVILLERPLHAEGFLRSIGSALNARLRQYEARARVADLHESETKFRAITESMPQIVWSAGPDGEHDFYNERWFAFTGVPHGFASGHGWRDLVHEDDRSQSWSAWRRSVATGDDYTIEYRLRREDGRYIWVLSRATPIRDGKGEVLRWMGTCTDIEEIVAARETLARSREELTQLIETRTEDLQTALSRLQAEVAERERAEAQLRQSQKLEAVGQLTGGVAHDFNNLLTVIGASAELLRKTDLPEERRRRYLSAITETVGRASKLTGQLLAFARRQPLKPEVFDVGHQVENVAELIRPLVGARVQIDLQLCSPACFAKADIGQFETALVNLSVNARDAMNDEGRLTIKLTEVDRMPPIRGQTSRAGPFVALSVTDTGTGIPADKIDAIFEPFFTTKEVGKGTGLGLSQVFGFAKQSGGDIQVSSPPGNGAVFTLYLPRAEARTLSADPGDGLPLLAGTLHHGEVLVVEDNEAVGQFSTEMLSDLGYHTTWAGNAAEALAILADATRHFDLVFSDVIMPGMNGVELAHIVQERFPGIPIVLTSGYSSVLAAEGRHGFELIQKPYSVESLSRVLHKVMAERPALLQ
jgi:PAS domain S-box-containing protein